MRSAVAGPGTVQIRGGQAPAPARLIFSVSQDFKPGDYVAVPVPGVGTYRFTIASGAELQWQAKEAATIDQAGFTGWFRSDVSKARDRGGARFVPNANHYLYVSPLDHNGNHDWYAYVDTTIPEKGVHPYTRDLWSGQVWRAANGARYDEVKLVADDHSRLDDLDGLVS